MKWIPENIPVIVDSEELPTASLVSLDLEYTENEEKREICLVGIFDGITYWAYTAVTDRLLSYLGKTGWITHDGIHAELPVLNKLYGGFEPERIQYDTKIMGYVFDSTLKDWGLKNLAKKYLAKEWPKYNELKKEYKFKSIKELPQEVLLDYNGSDCVFTWMLWEYYRKNFNLGHWNFYNNIELPMNHLLYRMEQKGIKVDVEVTKQLHEKFSRQRNGWDTAFRVNTNKLLDAVQWRKELLEIKKETAEKKQKALGSKTEEAVNKLSLADINLNSPQQILALLRALGYKVKSTDEDTIKRFGKDKVVKCLLEYRGYEKICTTYTSVILEEALKHPDRRIHARCTQSTITGRLASSDPINLQNQPPSVRSCFVAKEGHGFVEADWSNLEWRIPGHFSGDPAIISELSNRDGDIHRQTARLMFGQDVSDEQRRIAKTCNFLLTNSGRAKRLASELGCSYREADDIFNRFWAGYRVLGEWTKETKTLAKQNGGISTMFGRCVRLPDLRLWCGRANCPVVAKDYFCKECFKREETEREAVSVRVQGSGADLIKLAMLRLYREYKLVPVLTVHDSLLAEVPDNDVVEVGQNIKMVMESLVEFKVPLFVTIKTGKSWGNLSAVSE